MTTWQANVHKRRKARMDLSLYDKYMGQTGTGPFALPGTIDLFVRAVSATAVDTLALIVNGRSLYAKPLNAGGVYWMGRFSAGSTVEVQAGFELCVDAGLGNYKQIGPV